MKMIDTLPQRLLLMPPVEVAAAVLPMTSTATAPTVLTTKQMTRYVTKPKNSEINHNATIKKCENRVTVSDKLSNKNNKISTTFTKSRLYQ